MVNPYLGQVYLFAGNFVPRGYRKCDGYPQSIAENEALFSILGTMYGGDGRTTFHLPKIDKPAKGGIYVIAVVGEYPPRHR